MSDELVRDELEALVTEERSTQWTNLDAMSVPEILSVINREDQQVPAAVREEIPNIARAVDLAVNGLRQGGRLFYVGAGTSGRLGVLDASECPPTFGVDPALVQGIIAGGDRALRDASEGAEDDKASGAKDLQARQLGASDVVVGIAASGRTPYVIGALEEAKRAGATAVALSCNPHSVMASIAHVAISPVVGPEVLTGSTRMKAGTAQKLVLNMLSTTVMIKLGKIYSNLMVDLSPSNKKLVARSHRIIQLATGASESAAGRAFEASGGRPKVAIVMIETGVTAAEAVTLLERADGFVRGAIEIAGRAG